MTPLEILDALTAWIMASENREWFMFGMLVGMFLMFSILSGYWIVTDQIRRWLQRRRKW